MEPTKNIKLELYGEEDYPAFDNSYNKSMLLLDTIIHTNIVDINELKDKVKKAQADIVELQKDDAQNKADIADLKKQVAQNIADIKKAQADIIALQKDNIKNKSDILALQNDNTKNKADIENLKKATAENKANITALQEAVKNNTADISSIKVDIANITKTINTLRGDVDKNIADINKNAGDIVALRTDTNKNTEDIKKALDYEVKQDTINANIEARVKALEEGGSGTKTLVLYDDSKPIKLYGANAWDNNPVEYTLKNSIPNWATKLEFFCNIEDKYFKKGTKEFISEDDSLVKFKSNFSCITFPLSPIEGSDYKLSICTNELLNTLDGYNACVVNHTPFIINKNILTQKNMNLNEFIDDVNAFRNNGTGFNVTYQGENEAKKRNISGSQGVVNIYKITAIA